MPKTCFEPYSRDVYFLSDIHTTHDNLNRTNTRENLSRVNENLVRRSKRRRQAIIDQIRSLGVANRGTNKLGY